MPTQEFTPVEYWNPVFPNENIVLDGEEPDSASRRRVRFVAGYFRATKQWEAQAIEEFASDRAYKADTSSEMICPKCGWITKSTAAYQRHIAEEL